MRCLILVAALLLALPERAAAQARAPDLERDPFGFLVDALTARLDMLEVAPYGAPGLFGRDWRPLQVGLQLDPQRRRMRLRLGLGDHQVLAFGLRADMVLEGAASRVRTRLDLGVAGHGLSLRLPDVVVVPRFVNGRVVMEYRIPIIEKRF